MNIDNRRLVPLATCARGVLALLAVALLHACRRECASHAVIEKHRAAASAKIAQIAALAPVVAAAPPTTDEYWHPPDGVILDFSTYLPGGNAAVVYDVNLSVDCHGGSDWIDWFGPITGTARQDQSFVWLQGASCVLADNSACHEHDDEQQLVELERTTYLVVIRLLRLERSNVVWEKFRAVGDARLYEISTKKQLGAFTFDVSNDPKWPYVKTGDQRRWQFAEKVDEAIGAKLAKLAPAERPEARR